MAESVAMFNIYWDNGRRLERRVWPSYIVSAVVCGDVCQRQMRQCE